MTDEWVVSEKIKLLSGFCTMHITLYVRFQPDVKYVERNLYTLAPNLGIGWPLRSLSFPEVSEHIKSNYVGLLKDAIEKEIKRVEDGSWIGGGLAKIESRIANTVNETLTEQGIWCRARCDLEPSFDPLPADDTGTPTGHFRYERVYLEIMRRVHEFRTKREDQRRDQERNLNKQSKVDEDIRREKDSQKTERLKAKHEEKGKREAERRQHAFRMKEHEHNAHIQHELRIKQIKLQAKKQWRESRLKDAESFFESHQYESKRLELEKELKRRRTHWNLEIQNAADEAEIKLDQQRIANQEKRTRAEKLLEFDRQEAFLKILPQLLEQAAKSQPTIEHLRVLQVSSPDNQNSPVGNGQFGNHIVGAAQSLAYLKQLLHFLDEGA